jgi:hypothetical protein
MANISDQDAKIKEPNDANSINLVDSEMALDGIHELSSDDPSEVLDKCFRQIGFGKYQWVSSIIHQCHRQTFIDHRCRRCGFFAVWDGSLITCGR